MDRGSKWEIEDEEDSEDEYGDVPPDDDIRMYWEDWQMVKRDAHDRLDGIVKQIDEITRERLDNLANRIDDITQDKLNELGKHIDVVAIDTSIIKTVILGVPETENGGLVEAVKVNKKSISSLKKYVYIAIGIAIGSGIFGGIQFIGV